MLAKLNWPLVAVFFIVAASVTVLAVFKVIPANMIAAIVAGFVGWLAPSPVPLGATPPAPPVATLCLLGLGVVVFSACAAGASNAAYDADLATCDKAPTCADFVACRARAAQAAGRKYSGDCLGGLDGGRP